jgi:hypothetical protein
VPKNRSAPDISSAKILKIGEATLYRKIAGYQIRYEPTGKSEQ